MDDLPPLPLPWNYVYIWDEPGGVAHRDFSVARRNGTACDRVLTVYTADQMREYARAASAAQPPQPVAEPTDPLHDDAYVRAIALGFPQGDPRRWTLCRIADRIEAATPQPPQAVELTADDVWRNEQIMAINARAGLQMPLLMELVRAVLDAAKGSKL